MLFRSDHLDRGLVRVRGPAAHEDSSAHRVLPEAHGRDEPHVEVVLGAEREVREAEGQRTAVGVVVPVDEHRIDPGGHVLLHHRKIHELSMGHDLYTRGTQLRVAETRLGTIGLMICADAFVEGHFISRTLGLMGAQLILSPCAWAVPPDHDNSRTPYGGLWTGCYAPVAREFGLGIAGCSSVGSITSGPWAGWHCIGHSLVVDPHGKTQAVGKHGPDACELIVTDLDLELPRRPEYRPVP